MVRPVLFYMVKFVLEKKLRRCAWWLSASSACGWLERWCVNGTEARLTFLSTVRPARPPPPGWLLGRTRSAMTK